MKASVFGEQCVDILSLLPGIHDAQHLLPLGKLLGQSLQTQRAAVPVSDPAEFLKCNRKIRADFPDFQLRAELPEQISQYRLGGGTKNHSGTEVSRQICHDPHAGCQVAHGNHLSLVKYNHAVCDIVQLPALAGTVGIQ